MTCRAVRGATCVEDNIKEEIISETKAVLQKAVAENDIAIEDIVSVTFTVTQDLDVEFPAVAGRELGWQDVPMICATEIPVKGSLEKVIRFMMTFNSDKSNKDLKHVYINGAEKLRPDLTG